MISSDEALLILRDWLDKKSELLMTAKTVNFLVVSKCYVVALQQGEVTLWPVKDGAAKFTFSVDSEHLELDYSRIREFKDKPGMEEVPEEKLDNSALSISLPLQAIDPTNPLSLYIENIILQEL